ncbi:DUF5347 family protein [Xenorhabdus sp. XENO-10]|uniref:DUF5347 family protein n=1 Tax=Xenorhabdus yunnanensis TaxID=3025878 RepID=A0ABT5LDE4_9GAMM|nr:DUF5347 family protein [Xenorhabdus yunnanensis]MDC9588573.1 DUF5347 family protein [Xenorhabdus yunnanensis]
MANTEPFRAVSQTVDERIDGMNHTAKAHAIIFKKSKKSGELNSQLADFIDMMRDRSNNRIRNNERVLHLIFHLAGFDKSQFNNKLKDFTVEEQRSLISAIHQFKAVAAELPDKLIMPELISH